MVLSTISEKAENLYQQESNIVSENTLVYLILSSINKF